jgi:predicted MFS family arabinose efflux permease
MAAATVGALCGPVIGGVASAVGTELVFTLAALVGVGCMLATVRMPAPVRAGQASLRALWGAMRDPQVALGLWLMLIPGLLLGTIYVLAPLHLDRLGAGAAAITVAFVVASGLEAFISPFAGRLTDKRGPTVPALAGLAGGAVAMAVLPWPGVAWLLVVLVMCTAPLIGFLWTPSITLVSRGAEERGVEPGFAFALTNIAWALGQAIGSAGSGALAQATVDAVPHLLLAATCALTLVALRVRSRAPAPV